MAVAAAAVSVASTLYSGYQQRQQAKQQEKYQEQQNELVAKSMRDQYSQLSDAEAEAREQTLQEAQQNTVEYQKRKSRINLMSAVSGTGGLSVDSMMRDLRANRGENMNNIIHNQDVKLQQFRNKAEGIRTQTASRTDNRKINRPSWGAIGLKAAANGVSAYSGAGGSFGSSGGNASATLKSGNTYGSLQSSVDYGSSNQVSGGV